MTSMFFFCFYVLFSGFFFLPFWLLSCKNQSMYKFTPAVVFIVQFVRFCSFNKSCVVGNVTLKNVPLNTLLHLPLRTEIQNVTGEMKVNFL